MTRLTLFDSPLFLGFDHFERSLERVKKAGGDGYPPYNIEQTSDTNLRITLAVAGFTMDDLDVEIDNDQLTVRGKQVDDPERIFLHRGIAARQFQRSFVLADGIEITGATLDNGLLNIDLRRIVPDSNVQKISITQPGKKDEKKIIDVDTPGLATQDFSRLPFQRIRRPIVPLDNF